MRVLWVMAHPEPRSLNGALRDAGINRLTQLGHEVVESDLYAMHWNPVVTGDDFDHDSTDRLYILQESERAFRNKSLKPDIQREQNKLCWADTVIVQFPLWWFGPPAILKGWFDRLLVQGYAQGVPDPQTGRALRYGNGGLAGRRAMAITTVGANAATTGPRGIHGDINDVLFPLLHGVFWYTGMEVVPPLVINSSVHMSDTEFDTALARLDERLTTLPETDPIPYRRQDSGDYDQHLVLRPGYAEGREGIHVHYDPVNR